MQEGKKNETQLDVTDRENQNLYFFPSQKSSSYFCKQILKKMREKTDQCYKNLHTSTKQEL